jgi:hypothetical protein
MTNEDKNENVFEFPKQPAPEPTPDEKQASLTKEVRWLADKPVVEWQWQVRKRFVDQYRTKYGVEPDEMEKLVRAEIAQRDKQKRERDRKDEKHAKRIEQETKQQRRAEQIASDKEAKAKADTRAKGLQEIAKLPLALHDAKIEELAGKLGCGRCELRDELEVLVGSRDAYSSEPQLWHVEPWEEPVTTAKLLPAVIAKVAKHIDMESDDSLTYTLWALFRWVHDIATHSPLLVFSSAEPKSGDLPQAGLYAGAVAR